MGRLPVLAFVDRLVVTLAHLRLGTPHEALAVAFGVDRMSVNISPTSPPAATLDTAGSRRRSDADRAQRTCSAENCIRGAA
ncbi:transposase family protein [Polymorphospora sp. NPDC050346]|uniref:transposase family protein n=1 Tax=Polymorphospora sp. NPDC050346 TaxID=3155780 RepID=UPI003410FABE